MFLCLIHPYIKKKHFVQHYMSPCSCSTSAKLCIVLHFHQASGYLSHLKRNCTFLYIYISRPQLYFSYISKPSLPLLLGDFEKGVDHLTNAIAVCGQPQQLLQVLQQTLPPPVFQMLLTKLPTISQVRVSCISYSKRFNLYFLQRILTKPPGCICGLWDKKGCNINLRIQSWEPCVSSS